MLGNECKAIYSGSDLISRIYNGSDLVYPSQPEIKAVGMTLSSRTVLKFKVSSNGVNMDAVSVRVTYPNGEGDTSTEYSIVDGFYVYLHKMSAHRIPEPIKIELLHNSTVVQTRNAWTVAEYLDKVLALDSNNEELAALAESILNYGDYAAYYHNQTGDAPNISAVEAVTRDDLTTYKLKINKLDYTFGATCGLYITDVVDIKLKFNESAWNGHTLIIDGVAVPVTIEDGKVNYRIEDILPRDWGKNYLIQVIDTNGTTVIDIEYGIFSYAYGAVSSTQQTALQGLLKSMYLYHVAILKAEGFVNDSVL